MPAILTRVSQAVRSHPLRTTGAALSLTAAGAALAACSSILPGISNPSYRMPEKSPTTLYIEHPQGTCFTAGEAAAIGGGSLANVWSPGAYFTSPSTGFFEPSGVPIAQKVGQLLLDNVEAAACDARATATADTFEGAMNDVAPYLAHHANNDT